MRKDILKILGVSAEGKENAGSANQAKTSTEGSTWFATAGNWLNDTAQDIARKTAVAATQAAKFISDDPVANAIDQASELLQKSNSDQLSPYQQRKVVEIFLDAYAKYPKNSNFGEFNHLLYLLRTANGNNAAVKNNDLINALRTLKSEDALGDDNFIAVIEAADPLKEVDRIVSEEIKKRAQDQSQRGSSSEESVFAEPDRSFEDDSAFTWPSKPVAQTVESLDEGKSSELENEILALEEKGKQILKLLGKEEVKVFALAAADWQKEYSQFKAANNISAGNIREYQALEKLSSRFSSMGKLGVEKLKAQENRKKESAQGSESAADLRRSSDDVGPLPPLPEDSEDEMSRGSSDVGPLPSLPEDSEDEMSRSSSDVGSVSLEDAEEGMSEQSEIVEEAAPSSKKRSKKLPYIVEAENLINDSHDILKMIEFEQSDQSFKELEGEVEQWEGRFLDWQMNHFSEVSGKSFQKYHNIAGILQQRLDLLKTELKNYVGPLPPVESEEDREAVKIKPVEPEFKASKVKRPLMADAELIKIVARVAQIMNSDPILREDRNPLRKKFLALLNDDSNPQDRKDRILSIENKVKEWQKARAEIEVVLSQLKILNDAYPNVMDSNEKGFIESVKKATTLEEMQSDISDDLQQFKEIPQRLSASVSEKRVEDVVKDLKESIKSLDSEQKMRFNKELADVQQKYKSSDHVAYVVAVANLKKAVEEAPKKEKVSVKTIGKAMGGALLQRVEAARGKIQKDETGQKQNSYPKIPKVFQGLTTLLKKDRADEPKKEPGKKNKG